MSGYIGIDGKARKIGKLYIGVDGVARKVKKAYIGDANGKARLWYSSGTPLSNLTVGGTVKLKVNGTACSFIVVHKGIPSEVYDSSCDGIWLLMSNIYTSKQWYSSMKNDYANSAVHSYLNSTFLNLLDADVRNAIKQVKIPYRPGDGTDSAVSSGANGLSAKVFLLSATEIGFRTDGLPDGEGSVLNRFKSCPATGASTLRSADAQWWTRSPLCLANNGGRVITPSTTGKYSTAYGSYMVGVRPALILPEWTEIDENNYVIGA